MRCLVACVVLVGAIAASGCVEQGCSPLGGLVVWRQPGAFAVATDPAFDVTGTEVHRGEPPQGYELPPGHPIYSRFGENVRIVQSSYNDPGAEGGASIDWSHNGLHLIHYGGDTDDARQAVLGLVSLLAATPADASDWEHRHSAELDFEANRDAPVRTPPIELDLPLDLARAFNDTAEAAAATLEGEARLEILGDGVAWTVTPDSIRIIRDMEHVQVLGGNWVVADIRDNPDGLEDALARGRVAAKAVGLPDGPQLDGHFREQLICE